MKNSPYDLVIFDCDGVLVNSEPLANQVYCQLLEEHGQLVDVGKTQKEMYGLTLPSRLEISSKQFNWDPPENFLALFHERLAFLSDSKLTPVEGIHDLLDSLDVKKCVASNGYRAEINQRLKKCRLTEYFGNAIFSGMEVPHPKPAPDVYISAAEAFKTDPSRCIVIEDSLPGVTAAIRARMMVYGHAAFTPSESLRDAGAIPFTNMMELKNILAEI